MRNLLIILILAGAALAAWFLLQGEDEGGGGNSSAEAAQAALDQIGINNLKEQDAKAKNSFYQDEFDECEKACKKANCGWFARKCKGRCKTECLKQLQARHGLTSLYTESASSKSNKIYDAFMYGRDGKPIEKPALVRPYNPLSA